MFRQLPSSNVATVKRLRNRCVVALASVTAIVAITQAFAFLELRTMEGYAELVNIAGRQRMISQRLPRLVQSVRVARDPEAEKDARNALNALLLLFTESHGRIQDECLDSSATREGDRKAELIQEMTPAFRGIVSRTELFTKPQLSDSTLSLIEQDEECLLLGQDADRFLPLMDRLVKQIENEATDRLMFSRSIQLSSAILIVVLLCLVVAYILFPAMRHIQLSQQELIEQTAYANSMAAEADSANQSKSEFLANMSHEIRTPMTAVLGFTDILLDNLVEPENVDAARTVKENGQYLLSLINDILDLSKIESGKLEVEQIETSPKQVVADVASLMRVRAKSKGLPLDVRFDGPIPEKICSDPTRLRQILINLVGNAIKFTETGSVSIVTRLIDSAGQDPKLRFEVIDTGIGIPADKIESIFAPFAQADGSTTRKFGGTGLGLSISRRLAELLGGAFTVSSSVGKGSTFSITVATGSLQCVRLIEGSMEATADGVVQESTGGTDGRLTDYRILLAEDGPDNQRLISFILRKAGAKVTLAENGQIGLQLAMAARSEGRPFDVVLMDMQMPVLDGYSATRKLREAGYTEPIIALTAHAMATDRQKCLDAGCDCYATKPIDRKTLIKTVASYAEREGASEFAEEVVV